MATVSKNIPRSLVRLVPRLHEEHEAFIDDAENILLRRVKASIRKRFYRTGNLHNNTFTRKKKFKSFGTIEAYTSVAYARFGERGTRFMRARRMFALGLQEAKQEVIQSASNHMKKFARETK